MKRDQQLNKPAPTQPSILLAGEKPAGAVSDVKNIAVTRFEVDALAPYRGTTVSLKNLTPAIASLNKPYDAKGAKTSRAVRPAPDVKDGVVKIRLVEARLGGISISGDKWLSKSFVMDRIHQKPGDLLSVDRLEQDLVRFNSPSERFSLVTRLGAQYSFDEQLPSSEQFQAGGLFSVRGYSEALLTGRNGYTVSVELRALVYSPPSQQGAGLRPQVQVMTFIDHGAVCSYGYAQGTNTDHYLTSAGTGLMLDFGNRMSARVALAWALDTNPAEPRQINPAVLAGLRVSWL